MGDWSFQSPLSCLRQRAFLLAEIRQFFQERAVLEVQTPIVSSAANTDQQIDVFSTEAIHPDKKNAYLRTSPEFFHKRLLASGSGDIFEIAPVFRRGEISRLHNPEFTLLEWYRVNFDMSALMTEVDDLFHRLALHFELKPGQTEIITYQTLFINMAGFDPFDISDESLNVFCQDRGYHGADLTRTEALDFVFAVVIQPELKNKEGMMVYHFPIEQAALAQAHPHDKHTCLRFEFLYQGIELANGYQELQDESQQRQRFETDLNWRRQHNKQALPVDEHLLSALKHGMPACSGVAVGLERLHMCLIKANGIREVMGFDAHNS
ncbi:MAG: EF-P lysine aminoacylase EpmA [Proteobacteria bacterium]|jgi:lysyl-tRNA synthetase class 2|nr:EF-P lysine aminoacylase EpmA [Pseudomonadota bacterium]